MEERANSKFWLKLGFSVKVIKIIKKYIKKCFNKLHGGEILKFNQSHCRKVVNQKLATSNLNLRAPKFGHKDEGGADRGQDRDDGRGGGPHGLQIGGILAPMAVPVCILSTWGRAGSLNKRNKLNFLRPPEILLSLRFVTTSNVEYF